MEWRIKNVQSRVSEVIAKLDERSIFSIADFSKYGKYEAVRKALLRIEREGTIKRIYPGLYTKSVKDGDLSSERIAYAVARKCGWTIAPSGERCINLIGLRDFPYDRYTYLSSGTYRRYEILNQTITFRHVSEKDLTGLSYKAVVVVQALKTIGINNITPEDGRKIREYLTYQDKAMIKKECAKCTRWVYDSILSILDETNINSQGEFFS